ncbi:unnamed protein product, partial [Dovyalis caffra]
RADLAKSMVIILYEVIICLIIGELTKIWPLSLYTDLHTHDMKGRIFDTSRFEVFRTYIMAKVTTIETLWPLP